MLEVRQLHKSYQGRQVLAPLSFVLPPGQCLGLAGSNGSGKSTLLRLMAQIERADGGDVLYQGRSTGCFCGAPWATSPRTPNWPGS